LQKYIGVRRRDRSTLFGLADLDRHLVFADHAVARLTCNSGQWPPLASMGWPRIRRWLTTLGVATARPAAFLVFAAYAVAWLLLDPASLNWHSLATLATWFMTLVIQRAEHRDTQALHAKLDELLRADKIARTELVNIDDEEPEAIEERRAADRKRDE
jgi:low affinity Fe/Cu permease